MLFLDRLQGDKSIAIKPRSAYVKPQRANATCIKLPTRQIQSSGIEECQTKPQGAINMTSFVKVSKTYWPFDQFNIRLDSY